MYTAAVLTDQSRELLKWVLRATIDLERKHDWLLETPAGEPLPHHMTINMGERDKELNPKNILTHHVYIQVESFYFDRDIGACAAKVSRALEGSPQAFIGKIIRTINDEKSAQHITICLKEGVKPKMSNELFSERLADIVEIYPFDEPIKLEARFTIVR